MDKLSDEQKGLYLYGNISKCNVEELKDALRSFRAHDDAEGIMRIEGELLSRKELKVRDDYVTRESLQGPRKKEDSFFKLK